MLISTKTTYGIRWFDGNSWMDSSFKNPDLDIVLDHAEQMITTDNLVKDYVILRKVTTTEAFNRGELPDGN